MNKDWNKETICVKGGYDAKGSESIVAPLVQSTSYNFEGVEQVANLFDLKEEGHIYSRISNPTVQYLEKKFLQLEDGIGAVAVSSGQSATLLAILNICEVGDHIIAVSNIYGGSFNLLNITLKRLGIKTTFISAETELKEIVDIANPKTKLIFGETIGNPALNIFNFNTFSKAAKYIGVPLIVDNTLLTPYLFNPKKYGANIIIHSTSKYSDGHSVALGGIIVDCGNFNWSNGKFKCLTEPDESYHGIKYVESFNEAAYIVKLRVTLLRDLGSTMSPFNAFLTNLGLETLHLRMERHSINALKLAEFLQGNSKIQWVRYPLLEGNEDYKIAKEYFNNGASGVLIFGIKGGINSAKKLIDELNLVKLVVHLGDVRTTILHPASTTHRQLTEEELISTGVTPELIRVSVGIENIDDIIKDFQQALEKVSI